MCVYFMHVLFFIFDFWNLYVLFFHTLRICTGIHSVAYAYPKVTIITTAVDRTVNDQYHIIPGIGECFWW